MGPLSLLWAWGYYKLIPVENDYSRKILAYELEPDETTLVLSDVLELELENARKEGDLTKTDPMPKLYSDNGSGFTSKILAEYLSVHGIKHIFARPYHPQGRGKIERFNRRIKEKVRLMVYCSPGELRKALDEAIAIYNRTPHEALDNVSPNDVYAGRKEIVLQPRQEQLLTKFFIGYKVFLIAKRPSRELRYRELISVRA